MEKKQRFFIYDRREALVLILLGIMVAVFAFTLGVHLGKKAGGKEASSSPSVATELVPNVHDNPTREEMNERDREARAQASQEGGASSPADDSLSQALHDEVARTGVKLDSPKETELPTETKSKVGGATTGAPAPREIRPAPKSAPTTASEKYSATESKLRFTLQIGSYANQAEAQAKAKEADSHGLKSFVQSAEIRGKGIWYRVHVGSFASKEEAERVGQDYRSKSWIPDFIVTHSPSNEAARPQARE